MMRGCIASLVLLMVLIAGCSNPWNPYPYFNPKVTDKARRGKAKPEVPVQESTESVIQSETPENVISDNDTALPVPVAQDETSASTSDDAENLPADLFEEPSFPYDTGSTGDSTVPYSK